MPPAAYDIVLFDLGGVLLEFGGVEAMRKLSGIDSDDELWRRWLTCQWVRRFESGGCAAGDFAAGVVSDWGIEVGAARFLEEFRSWPRGPIAGALELVREVHAAVRVGCLSNTNALHWAAQRDRWPLDDLFDVAFLSHEVGHVKPDREIFEHVVQELGVPVERIVFLDDNAMNVDQARAVGLSAHRVRGPAEARAVLADLGLCRADPPANSADLCR